MTKPDRLGAELSLYRSDAEAWAAYIWLKNARSDTKKKAVWDLLTDSQQDSIRKLKDLV